MRIGVVGCGSIGLRHLRNLQILGRNDLIAFDPAPETRRAAALQLGIAVAERLEDLWEAKPTAAFITSPTSLHVAHASEAVRANCHLFIEKPLSHEAAGLAQLRAEIEKRRLITLVGCNMRFHPGPKRIRKLLDDGAVGRVCSARVYTGSYLPEWRPRQDYRLGYSANASMGGGCILDCIHEIDLARWYFGEVEEVMCMAGHLSSLEVDVEDVAALLCRHRGGTISEIHLDYMRRPSGRGCEIYGDEGTIAWTMEERKVRHFRAAAREWQELEQPQGWELNQMYIDEIQHFLQCVEAGRESVCPVSEAIQVMRIALAAKCSATTRACVKTGEAMN